MTALSCVNYCREARRAEWTKWVFCHFEDVVCRNRLRAFIIFHVTADGKRPKNRMRNEEYSIFDAQNNDTNNEKISIRFRIFRCRTCTVILSYSLRECLRRFELKRQNMFRGHFAVYSSFCDWVEKEKNDEARAHLRISHSPEIFIFFSLYLCVRTMNIVCHLHVITVKPCLIPSHAVCLDASIVWMF